MTTSHVANDYSISFMNILNRTTTTLMCWTPTETILGNNGPSDDPEWLLQGYHDLEITSGCNEWSLNITQDRGLGVEMPVHMAGSEFTRFVDERIMIPIHRDKARDPVTQYASEHGFAVYEDIVVDDQIRPPREPGESPGAYRIAGTGTDGARVVIIDENTWEVEHTRLVPEGNYEVPGLQSGLKTVVSRKSDGEIVGYGAVEAVPEV